jgi:hypothetical protein
VRRGSTADGVGEPTSCRAAISEARRLLCLGVWVLRVCLRVRCLLLRFWRLPRPAAARARLTSAAVVWQACPQAGARVAQLAAPLMEARGPAERERPAARAEHPAARAEHPAARAEREHPAGSRVAAEARRPAGVARFPGRRATGARAGSGEPVAAPIACSVACAPRRGSPAWNLVAARVR